MSPFQAQVLLSMLSVFQLSEAQIERPMNIITPR
jgi:hypothetical protein